MSILGPRARHQALSSVDQNANQGADGKGNPERLVRMFPDDLIGLAKAGRGAAFQLSSQRLGPVEDGIQLSCSLLVKLPGSGLEQFLNVANDDLEIRLKLRGSGGQIRRFREGKMGFHGPVMNRGRRYVKPHLSPVDVFRCFRGETLLAN